MENLISVLFQDWYSPEDMPQQARMNQEEDP